MSLKRSVLARRTPLRSDPEVKRAFAERGRRASAKTMSKRRPISECTPAQREKCRPASCLVCGETPCDPCHLIPRGLCPTGADDIRAVVPCCRTHHRAYDQERTLSVLEYLEPYHRAELAFAVERFGLLSTLERLTNCHWRETSL